MVWWEMQLLTSSYGDRCAAPIATPYSFPWSIPMEFLCNLTRVSSIAAFAAIFIMGAIGQGQPTAVLVDVDHRKALSLDGEWQIIFQRQLPCEDSIADATTAGCSGGLEQERSQL
jgi:hypothetical protein